MIMIPKNLQAIDKIHLVELILNSLDSPDPEIERVWVEESEKRYEAYKQGKSKAISLPDSV